MQTARQMFNFHHQQQEILSRLQQQEQQHVDACFLGRHSMRFAIMHHRQNLLSLLKQQDSVRFVCLKLLGSTGQGLGMPHGGGKQMKGCTMIQEVYHSSAQPSGLIGTKFPCHHCNRPQLCGSGQATMDLDCYGHAVYGTGISHHLQMIMEWLRGNAM